MRSTANAVVADPLRISCIVLAWSDDIGSPPTMSVEEELYVDEHETIFAIRDQKPERYGSADTEWQKCSFPAASDATSLSSEALSMPVAVP